jgi:hypothetical protein
MRLSFTLLSRGRLLLIIAALVLAGAGCSEAKKAAAAASAAGNINPERIASAAAVSAANLTTARPRRSVFTVDDNIRDPFFPKAKKVTLVAAVERSAIAIDIPTLLQTEFQGVIGSGEERIAVINNVMLVPGRHAIIPLRSDGQEHNINVRCREISRNSVVLEVQGYPQPLTITRTQR